MLSWIRHYVAEVCAPPSALLVMYATYNVKIQNIMQRFLMWSSKQWESLSFNPFSIPRPHLSTSEEFSHTHHQPLPTVPWHHLVHRLPEWEQTVVWACRESGLQQLPFLQDIIHTARYQDRTLQDITTKEEPMGGKAVLLWGDFRQILPVVKNGTHAIVVNASIACSHLWPSIQVEHLIANMNVLLRGEAKAGEFSKQLQQVGDGLFALLLCGSVTD